MSKFFFILISIFFLFSCTSNKHVSTSDSVPTIKSEATVLKKVEEANLNFEWLRYKASTNLIKEGETRSFKTNVRIRRDSLMWMSISKAIQAFKISLSLDSVKLINDLESTYSIGTFDMLSEQFGVELSYHFIQNMLVGNTIEGKELRKMKVTNQEDYYLLSNLNKNKLQKYSKNKSLKNDSVWLRYWISPDDFKVVRCRYDILAEGDSSSGVEIIYDDFVTISSESSQEIPSTILFSVDDKNKEVFRMSFKLSKIKSTLPFRFPFDIPKGYDLLDLLKK